MTDASAATVPKDTAPARRGERPGSQDALDRLLGMRFLERECITSEQLREAMARQRLDEVPLVDAMVGLSLITIEQALAEVSEILDVPAINLAVTYGDATIVEVLPRPRAFDLKAIPLFSVGNELTVAMSRPFDLTVMDELRFITNKKILPAYALETDIEQHLPRYYGAYDPAVEQFTVEFEPTGVSTDLDEVSVEDPELDRPIVRLVNLIFSSAIAERATDIHLEPGEKHMSVRFRRDGVLQVKPYEIPREAIASVVSRIKILGSIDISDRRLPQDGKIRIRYQDRAIDVRVSTFPAIYGEKVVMRVLDKERMNFSLDNIGMSREIRAGWEEVLRHREGLVLVTGPTGSGKSSTLFASLRRLNDASVNIVTLEDPVEYELDGVTQGQVNNVAGFTFARGLRSILRQDPDIILVGEIRDLETAQIAVQAALTGHLVLATLHTNDAPSATTRLLDMGVAPYLLASCLRGVLAQRLVRKICPDCRTKVEPPEELREQFEPWLEDYPFLEAKGCSECGEVGYNGRVGVHELFTVNDHVRNLIAQKAPSVELCDSAGEIGYRRMWWDGLGKVGEEKTSLTELARVVEPIHS